MPLVKRIGSLAARASASVLGRRVRTVPAAVLRGSETIHLGGGESIPCPGIDQLPLARQAKLRGLGLPSLALPPAKVYVLKDVRICPGSRVVATKDGRVVAESLTTDMIDSLDLVTSELRSDPLRLDGTIALYRSPWRPQFHSLVDHLPRAALLSQPAMRRLGQITLVHDGALSDVEERWLPRLAGQNVRLLRVEPGTALVADRILLPGFVTRPFAGALPSWYRRWVDHEVASLRPATEVTAGAPRRYFVERLGGTRRVRNVDALQEVLDRHAVTTIRPSGMKVAERMATFRDAEMVIGVTGSGLANLVFSRSTRIVELLPGTQLLPNFYYLAASKGLPYHYVPVIGDDLPMDAVERLGMDVHVDVEALDEVLTKVC